MIDYDKPDDDPVVAEVRRIRGDLIAEYNYDLTAYCEAIMRRQATSGRQYATPPPQTDAPAPTEPAKRVG